MEAGATVLPPATGLHVTDRSLQRASPVLFSHTRVRQATKGTQDSPMRRSGRQHNNATQHFFPPLLSLRVTPHGGACSACVTRDFYQNLSSELRILLPVLGRHQYQAAAHKSFFLYVHSSCMHQMDPLFISLGSTCMTMDALSRTNRLIKSFSVHSSCMQYDPFCLKRESLEPAEPVSNLHATSYFPHC